MKKWKYEVVKEPIGNLAEFTRYLNRKGNEGWKVLAIDVRQVDQTEDPEAVVVFGREE